MLVRTLVTACLLSGLLGGAEPALKISVYATAGGVQQLLANAQRRAKFGGHILIIDYTIFTGWN